MKENINREPWLAALLSMLFVGLGQIYGRKFIKGILLFVSIAINSLIIVNCFINGRFIISALLTILNFAIYIFNIVDAFFSIRKNNTDEFENTRKMDKDPWLSVFLTNIIPGVGHFYLKKILLGIGFLILGLVAVPLLAGLIEISDNFIANALIQSLVIYSAKAGILFHAYVNSPNKREKSLKVISIIAALVIFNSLFTISRARWIINNVVQAYYIPTGAMRDTIREGDHLFVEKVTMSKSTSKLFFLKYREFERGDIVIFKPPHERGKDFIKRIIALPGDTFDIKDSKIMLNGKSIEEPYAKGETKYCYFSSPCDHEKERIRGVVPPGKVVVLGDNREDSSDSRVFGYLDMERISGRAFLLYWNTREIISGDFSRLGILQQ